MCPDSSSVMRDEAAGPCVAPRCWRMTEDGTPAEVRQLEATGQSGALVRLARPGDPATEGCSGIRNGRSS
jgi:hypothetical protein